MQAKFHSLPRSQPCRLGLLVPIVAKVVGAGDLKNIKRVAATHAAPKKNAPLAIATATKTLESVCHTAAVSTLTRRGCHGGASRAL